MRSDRFDYLELGEQSPVPQPDEGQEQPQEAKAGSTRPASYVPTGNDFSVGMFDGRPMAQVQHSDLRGYAQALEMSEDEVTLLEQDAIERARRQAQLKTRRSLQVVQVFGERGVGAGQFNFPAGLAVDRDGVLFVADTYNHRVQRITVEGEVFLLSSRGSRPGKFAAPMGVAVDEDRAFYIVEQGNHRVQKFTSGGNLELSFGRVGQNKGEFRSPMGIAVMPGTKDIFVADTGNGRVQWFDGSGCFIGILGGPGSIHPPLSNPQAVACDVSGNIFVADTLANRIARYDPRGRFIDFYGCPVGHKLRAKASDVRFQEPRALTSDEKGELYVADGDIGSGRLTVLGITTGDISESIDKVGRGLGSLSRPGGLALAPQHRGGVSGSLDRGDIYLSDTMNHRILRFAWK